MIKAVIFDLGGVLIDDPSPGMIRYFASTSGLPEAAFYDLDLLPLPEFQKGLISEETFWKKACPNLHEGMRGPNRCEGRLFDGNTNRKKRCFL